MDETTLHILLNGTAEPAFIVDEHMRFCAWNGAARQLLGYSNSDFAGATCADLLQGRRSAANCICGEQCGVVQCALANRSIPSFEMEVRLRSGQWLWVSTGIIVWRGVTSNHLIIHLLRDFNRYKRTEALTSQLLQTARQLASWSDKGGCPSCPISPLTCQEQRILRSLASGNAPSLILIDLNISARTLRNHLHHINLKLHTHNRLEAVMYARRRRLI